jgi:hypothetical protein
MKLRMTSFLVLFASLVLPLRANSLPSVESRGAFVKISFGPGSVDIPAELKPPELLYLRKVTILRISVVYDAHNSDYETAITVFGGDASARPSAPATGAQAPTVDTLKTYRYRFPNESGAESFCEAILQNQQG